MILIASLGIFSFLLSLIATPIVRDFFARRNVVDRPDHFRKLHAKAIPRLGGIGIACAYAGSFLLVMALPISNSGMLTAALPGVWKLSLAAALVFFTGLIDDLVGIAPSWKLAEQVLAACMAYVAGVRINIIAGADLDPWLSLPATVLWIVGCTNAFNLIDGLDGLAAGVGLFATLTIVVAAVSLHNVPLVIVTVPLVGALLGFLRYNFNPASVFLGDSGSLLIGFLLGCYGVLWSQKSATMLGMTAPMMAMSIPLMDAALAIARRFIRRQPIFNGDRGHIHHKLLDLGFSPRRAVLLLYAGSGVAAVLSLVQNATQSQHHFGGGLVVVLFCASAWMGVQHLGYVEFGMARQMFIKGQFRKMIDFETRLQAFEADLVKSNSLESFWDQVESGARRFGFVATQMRVGDQVLGTEQMPSVDNLWMIVVPVGPGASIVLHHGYAPDSSVNVGHFVSVLRASGSARLAEVRAAREKRAVSVLCVGPQPNADVLAG